MTIIAGPNGTRDFYPEDMAFQEHIFSSWRSTCRRYGFEPYEGPMFEHLDLFTKKSGEEIEKQLYTFEDKGGRPMALRPELTPTLARMAAAKGNNLKRPLRWYSIPRLFRYERTQKGRLREFFQLNMDILGIEGVSADAELIAAAIDMMRDLKFTEEDFSVRISSRTLLEELFLNAGVPGEKLKALYGLFDKKHKISDDDFGVELGALVHDEHQWHTINKILKIQSVDDILGINSDCKALKDLKELFSLLKLYGMEKFIALDTSIVRGLAYYTGIVFEVFDRKKSLRAIAGGGRYDHLVKLYGGPDTPAAGFAAGDVVLGEMLRAKFGTSALPPRSEVFVASFERAGFARAVEIAGLIRKAGISCEFSLKNAGIGKQMESAHAARSPVVVFVGGDEEKEGKVKIKDMRTGEESTIEAGRLTEILLPPIRPPLSH